MGKGKGQGWRGGDSRDLGTMNLSKEGHSAGFSVSFSLVWAN